MCISWCANEMFIHPFPLFQLLTQIYFVNYVICSSVRYMYVG